MCIFTARTCASLSPRPCARRLASTSPFVSLTPTKTLRQSRQTPTTSPHMDAVNPPRSAPRHTSHHVPSPPTGPLPRQISPSAPQPDGCSLTASTDGARSSTPALHRPVHPVITRSSVSSAATHGSCRQHASLRTQRRGGIASMVEPRRSIQPAKTLSAKKKISSFTHSLTHAVLTILTAQRNVELHGRTRSPARHGTAGSPAFPARTRASCRARRGLAACG